MISLLKSKKGFGMARIYIGIVIFLVLFGFLNMFAYALLKEFETSFTSAGVLIGVAKTAFDGYLFALTTLDYVLVLLLAIFTIGVAITSFRVAVSPAFFILEFIAAAFYGFVSYFFNYMFIQLVSDSFFVVAKSAFTNTLIICTNLHWILLANLVIGSIAFFAKREKGQFLT